MPMSVRLPALFDSPAVHGQAAGISGASRPHHCSGSSHNLIRQALTSSGDIVPAGGFLTIRLDPLPTQRATTAIGV
jgi:hypothetical protein